MAFSDAFARGYAIGDAAKKRAAAAKYFKKMKELTSDEESVEEVTEIGGIDVPNSAISVGEGGVGEPAIPAPDAISAGSTVGPEAPETPEVDALAPAESAIPIEDTPVPVNEEAESPIQVAAPKTIKLKSDAEAKKIKERRKSLSQENIKELDRLAMDAAKASGDIEVYTALQRTTDSFLQAKVLKYMGQAQTAATEGDTAALKASLEKAYRFVPDGHEPNFKEKDGKLFVDDPWEDGKEIELDGAMVGNLTTMLRDPQRWAEIVREGRRERKADARDERRTAAAEAAAAEDRRANGVKELMDRKNFDREKANDVFDNLYKMALAGEAWAKAKEGSLPGGMKPDDARQYGESVSEAMDDYLTPTKPSDDPLAKPTRGAPPEGFGMFVSPEGGLSELGFQAKSLAGRLGIRNPEKGPVDAARAGLEVVRSMVSDEEGGPEITILPGSNEIVLVLDGVESTWSVDPDFIRGMRKAARLQEDFEKRASKSATWRFPDK